MLKVFKVHVAGGGELPSDVRVGENWVVAHGADRATAHVTAALERANSDGRSDFYIHEVKLVSHTVQVVSSE